MAAYNCGQFTCTATEFGATGLPSFVSSFAPGTPSAANEYWRFTFTDTSVVARHQINIHCSLVDWPVATWPTVQEFGPAFFLDVIDQRATIADQHAYIDTLPYSFALGTTILDSIPNYTTAEIQLSFPAATPAFSHTFTTPQTTTITAQSLNIGHSGTAVATDEGQHSLVLLAEGKQPPFLSGPVQSVSFPFTVTFYSYVFDGPANDKVYMINNDVV